MTTAAGVRRRRENRRSVEHRNYLVGLNIRAAAGFGLDYLVLHATDGRFRIDTISIAQGFYRHAMLTLQGAM